MGISSRKLADEAIRLLSLPEIPYVLGGTTINGLDCQGMIKYCAQRLGLRLDYSGSNDMYRNACSWIGTITEARTEDRIIPGAVAFIVEYDGQEAARYKSDGLGNASHVGLLTINGEAYSVDASSSAGKVRCRNERDSLRTWTHIGWLKGVDYDEELPVANISEDMPLMNNESVKTYNLQTATVVTLDGGALNMRSTPSDSANNRIGRAAAGSLVEVLEVRGEWTKIRYEGMTAWAQTKYLSMSEPSNLSHQETQNIPQKANKNRSILVTLPEDIARILHTELDAALFG